MRNKLKRINVIMLIIKSIRYGVIIIYSKSIKSYRALDLIAISIIGFIIEVLATKFLGQVSISAPTMVISLLIVFLAVTRWDLWGLITIPVMVAGNLLGGHLNSIEFLSLIYDWKLELSSAIAMASIGLNVIFYKKFTTKCCMDSFLKVIGFVLADYLVYTLLQIALYRLFTSGNPFQIGLIEYLYTNTKTGQEEMYNLCLFVENEYIYNLYGLGISIAGILLLRSQGATANAIAKLIDDKKQVELNIIDQGFRIELDEDESTEKEESQDTSDDSEKKF